MRHGAIELDFGGAERTFRLGLGEIEELEDKAGLGLFRIMDALSPQTRGVRVKVISETLRIGLIGGGMLPAEALALVRRYCDERPLTESLLIAYAVVVAGVTRVNGTVMTKAGNDSPGEAPAAETDAPTSPPSTEPVS